MREERERERGTCMCVCYARMGARMMSGVIDTYHGGAAGQGDGSGASSAAERSKHVYDAAWGEGRG